MNKRVEFLIACREHGMDRVEAEYLYKQGYTLVWELRGDEYYPFLADQEGWPCLWPV